MPIYEYVCDDCGASTEVLQKMSDDPLEVCTHCGGRLRKVLHPVAIHFKGSGFYTTDYGRGSGRRPAERDGAGDAGDTPSDGTPAKTDKKAKPAQTDGDGKRKESKAAG